MKIKAIITGATGMVGEGVLIECIKHPDVESVLIIGRKSCGIKHPKLNEVIHKDFFDLTEIKDQLSGYNACYFCSGISSLGKREEEYTKITYDLTMSFAGTIAQINPGMDFVYVSGTGTDNTEKGKIMWARVKGKTENDLLKLPFKAAYMFRPGYIQPTKGQKNAYKIHKIVAPLFPLWKLFFGKYVVKLEDVGRAMINVTISGHKKPILECAEITQLANKQ
jgi:uncharacterized protein YbjT (DUF2867 family)